MINNQSSNQILTEKQQAVVFAEQYPQYLRAAAGTGKTEVLIQKIINILLSNEQISLNDFGIITFTNKATDEMRNRLRDGLYQQWLKFSQAGDDAADRIRHQVEITSMADINTIHGFCERILRQYGLSIDLPLDFKIKSFRYEATQIIDKIVNEKIGHSLLSKIPMYRMSKLVSLLLNECGNKGIHINKKMVDLLLLDTPENEYWNQFKPLFLNIFITAAERIEEEKASKSILTANDLISKVVKLLRKKYVASRVAERYKYLFIDEFQDTNKDQFDFVKSLITCGVKVFLVGDDKQSVYAFRGADIENSQAMNEHVQSFLLSDESLTLDENFRSDETLIHAINRIFSQKFFFSGKEVMFPTVPLSVPKIKRGTGEKKPINAVFGVEVSKIIESTLKSQINGRDVCYGDIAILCRRNFDLDVIGTDLRKKGYPVEIVGGKGFFRSKEIIDTYKLFNAVLYHDSEHINELIFTNYYNTLINSEKTNHFNEFYNKLKIAFRSETVESLFSIIFEETRILEYYRQNNNVQAIYNLLKLRDKSREMMGVENLQPLQFLEYMRIMIMTKQDEDDAEIPEEERTNGVIRLYTIHKAKGLSFPIVIVPCLDAKLNRPITLPKVIFDVKATPPRLAFDKSALSDDLPPDCDYNDMLSVNQIKQLEEEVRIFYVACTRAKHRLILSSKKDIGAVKNTLKWDSYASVMKWLLLMRKEKPV